MTGLDLTDLFQTAVPTLALVFLIHQIRLQRKEVEYQREAIEHQREEMAREVEVRRFEVYERLTQRYADLLERASLDTDLNCIYQPLDATRRVELEEAYAADPLWGAWEAMTYEEQKGFRYTRVALEVCEQAHQVHELGWVDDETWRKWHTWSLTFSRTRYFKYVLNLSEERSTRRFRSTFVEYLQNEVLGERAQREHWAMRETRGA